MESGDIYCWVEICYRKVTGKLCVARQPLNIHRVFEGFYVFESDCYISVCVIGEISQLVMYQDPKCPSLSLKT